MLVEIKVNVDKLFEEQEREERVAASESPRGNLKQCRLRAPAGAPRSLEDIPEQFRHPLRPPRRKG